MFFDDLLLDEDLHPKHRTFVRLFYIEKVITYTNAKQFGISERTFFRRKKELGKIVQRKWQENDNYYLQKAKKETKRIHNIISAFI